MTSGTPTQVSAELEKTPVQHVHYRGEALPMPSCRDVARAIAVDELEQTSAWRRLRLRLHLLLCHHCRRYFAQIQAIGRAARDQLDGPPAVEGTEQRLLDKILNSRTATSRRSEE